MSFIDKTEILCSWIHYLAPTYYGSCVHRDWLNTDGQISLILGWPNLWLPGWRYFRTGYQRNWDISAAPTMPVLNQRFKMVLVETEITLEMLFDLSLTQFTTRWSRKWCHLYHSKVPVLMLNYVLDSKNKHNEGSENFLVSDSQQTLCI